jgi:hypothetical protein
VRASGAAAPSPWNHPNVETAASITTPTAASATVRRDPAADRTGSSKSGGVADVAGDGAASSLTNSSHDGSGGGPPGKREIRRGCTRLPPPAAVLL